MIIYANFIVFLALVSGVLFGILSIISLVCKFSGDEDGPPLALILLCGGIFIPCFSWFLISNYEKNNRPVIVQEEICNIKTITGDLFDYQVITYQDQKSGDYYSINVNSKYGQMFGAGDVIKVTKYLQGPYFGLYWNIPNKYEIIISINNKNQTRAC
jgi:hypothetical protein